MWKIAPGGVGKSSLAIAEATAMVTRRPLLSVPVQERLRVWYMNVEDPAEETERRVQALMIHYGITPKEVEGYLFTDSGRDQPVVIAKRVGADVVVQAPVVDELLMTIEVNQIDVVIIDPFVNSHEVPENENGALNAVIKTWALIASKEKCAVELIHHVRKPSAQQTEITLDDARGVGALAAGLRSARVLNVMSKDEAARPNIEEQQRRRYFRVSTEKSNMRAVVGDADWRQLISIGLGNGTDDYPKDQVDVTISWSLLDSFAGVSAAHLSQVQCKIAEKEWVASIQAKDWAGYAVAEVLGVDTNDPAGKNPVKQLLKTRLKSGALREEEGYDAKRVGNVL
jgi:hypothetical protein